MLDCVTGVIKACKKKKLNSTTMRNGFFKKISEIIFLITVYLIDYSCSEFNIDIPITGDIVNACIVYVTIMEIVSIFENLADCGFSTVEKLLNLVGIERRE